MKEESKELWAKIIAGIIAILIEMAAGGLAIWILVMMAGIIISFWEGVMAFFCLKVIYHLLAKTEIF